MPNIFCPAMLEVWRFNIHLASFRCDDVDDVFVPFQWHGKIQCDDIKEHGLMTTLSLPLEQVVSFEFHVRNLLCADTCQQIVHFTESPDAVFSTSVKIFCTSISRAFKLQASLTMIASLREEGGVQRNSP